MRHATCNIQVCVASLRLGSGAYTKRDAHPSFILNETPPFRSAWIGTEQRDHTGIYPASRPRRRLETPRTAQLYAKREQASLNRINNFVNRSTPLHFDDDQEDTEGGKSPANTIEKKNLNTLKLAPIKIMKK